MKKQTKKAMPLIVKAGGRKTWDFNPVTRVVKEKTKYNRKRAKRVIVE